jgi:hypothetical protein
MKNYGKITGMLLILFALCNLPVSGQLGMRGMKADSAGMNLFMCPMYAMGWNAACGMRPAGNMRHMGPGMRGMAPGMGRNAMGKKQPGMGNRQAAPGIRVMENIPNLTDKQKKDIADLRQRQKDEMQKLKGEMQKKMSDLRESHKTNVMNILSDEQKKWLEENTPKPLNN